MKKTLLPWLTSLAVDASKSWPPAREYVKKWWLASFLLIVAVTVGETYYANAACTLLRANVAGDPTLTENQHFVLSAMLHYPVFLFRAFEFGMMAILVVTTVVLCLFDGLLAYSVKQKGKQTPDETIAEAGHDSSQSHLMTNVRAIMLCIIWSALSACLFMRGVNTDALPAESAFSVGIKIWLLNLTGWLFSLLPVVCFIDGCLNRHAGIRRLITRYALPVILSLLMSLYIFIQRYALWEVNHQPVFLFYIVWCLLFLLCRQRQR